MRKLEIIVAVLLWTAFIGCQSSNPENTSAESTPLIYHGVTTHRWSSFVTPGAGQADEALTALLSGRWSQVRGFAWWNDYWQNDSEPANNTEMRVEAVPELASVFKTKLASSNIGDRPPVFKE